MPTFELNKLIRDGFRKIYADIGQVATYKKITADEHKKSLIDKIIEEVSEIPLDGSVDDIASEIADLQQVLDDLTTLCGVSKDQIKQMQEKIFAKKGGFLEGTYITTIKLKDDDPWVEYYRKYPERFSEVG